MQRDRERENQERSSGARNKHVVATGQPGAEVCCGREGVLGDTGKDLDFFTRRSLTHCYLFIIR